MQNIFIHGLGQNPSSWDKTVSFFTQPISILRPNLLAILNESEVGYTNLYHAFSDYCNNISEPLNLCGLSLGGILALNYAIDYPMKVTSLVLCATQYKVPKVLFHFQNILVRLMPKSSFKNKGFSKNYFIQLTNSMINLDFSKKIKDISCPTLVICGNKDGANKKAAKCLAEYIPRAKLTFLKNVGHEINTENPKELALVVERFLLSIKDNDE